MATLDEQHEVLARAFAHDLGCLASGAGGLDAVPQAVDTGHERTLREEADDPKVSARRLATPAPRGDAPLDRLPRRTFRHGGCVPRADVRARRGTSTSS